jgi:uncharacterized protein involved in exopolysaccharide biosynthesis
MKLLVNGERNNLFAVSSGDFDVDASSRPSDIRVNSEIELLRSADVLKQVVLKAGLEQLEFGTSHSAGETSPFTVEKAWHRLEGDLKVAPVKNSDVIRIAYSADAPELARTVLKELADTYLEMHVKARSRPGNFKFLQRQSIVWHRELMRAENDLVRFRKMYSDSVLPEERGAFAKRAVEAQGAFEQADAQLAQYRKKVAEARVQLKASLKTAVQARAVIKRAVLNSAFSQSQPDKSRDSSQAAQTAESSLITAQVELAGLEDLRDRLKQIANRYRKSMFQLATTTIVHDSLLRQVKENEDHYLLYARKEEEARIAESLDSERVANAAVAETPTVPVAPSNSKLVVDLPLALLLSLCCGFIVVLFVEFLTPSALLTYAAVKQAVDAAE